MKATSAALCAAAFLGGCDSHPSSCDHATALDLAGKQHLYGRVARGAPELAGFDGIAEITGDTGDASRIYCSGTALLADGSREEVFWSFSRTSGWPVSAPHISSCMPAHDVEPCGRAIPPAWDGVPR